jgi:Tfp pilus assembly protein PilP
MRMHYLLPAALLLTAVSACGEDDPPPPPPKAGAAKPGAKPGAKSGKAPPPIAVRTRIEDRVIDPEEKKGIRHSFKDKDFIAETTNRDPFQSFVLNQGIIGPEATKPQIAITKKCREDNLVATNYSYTDLRLVGIVAQGTQRKVLMMDAGNLGHIIRRGDCVGRERAYVKDIGTGYVTFEVNPDETNNGTVRNAEERSVQLYPNQMPVTSQPNLDNEPVRPQTPDVAPPTSPPPTPERK